jgi:hypothetical protein
VKKWEGAEMTAGRVGVAEVVSWWEAGERKEGIKRAAASSSRRLLSGRSQDSFAEYVRRRSPHPEH